MDMETIPSKRWVPKALALYEYRLRGRYTERFGTRSLRVLCVSPGESRQKLLAKWTEKVIPKKWQPLFWFTTQDRVTIEGALTGPIWQVLGEEGESPIFPV